MSSTTQGAGTHEPPKVLRCDGSFHQKGDPLRKATGSDFRQRAWKCPA